MKKKKDSKTPNKGAKKKKTENLNKAEKYMKLNPQKTAKEAADKYDVKLKTLLERIRLAEKRIDRDRTNQEKNLKRINQNKIIKTRESDYADIASSDEEKEQEYRGGSGNGARKKGVKIYDYDEVKKVRAEIAKNKEPTLSTTGGDTEHLRRLQDKDKPSPSQLSSEEFIVEAIRENTDKKIIWGVEQVSKFIQQTFKTMRKEFMGDFPGKKKLKSKMVKMFHENKELVDLFRTNQEKNRKRMNQNKIIKTRESDYADIASSDEEKEQEYRGGSGNGARKKGVKIYDYDEVKKVHAEIAKNKEPIISKTGGDSEHIRRLEGEICFLEDTIDHITAEYEWKLNEQEKKFEKQETSFRKTQNDVDLQIKKIIYLFDRISEAMSESHCPAICYKIVSSITIEEEYQQPSSSDPIHREWDYLLLKHKQFIKEYAPSFFSLGSNSQINKELRKSIKSIVEACDDTLGTEYEESRIISVSQCQNQSQGKRETLSGPGSSDVSPIFFKHIKTQINRVRSLSELVQEQTSEDFKKIGKLLNQLMKTINLNFPDEALASSREEILRFVGIKNEFEPIRSKVFYDAFHQLTPCLLNQKCNKDPNYINALDTLSKKVLISEKFLLARASEEMGLKEEKKQKKEEEEEEEEEGVDDNNNEIHCFKSPDILEPKIEADFSCVTNTKMQLDVNEEIVEKETEKEREWEESSTQELKKRSEEKTDTGRETHMEVERKSVEKTDTGRETQMEIETRVEEEIDIPLEREMEGKRNTEEEEEEIQKKKTLAYRIQMEEVLAQKLPFPILQSTSSVSQSEEDEEEEEDIADVDNNNKVDDNGNKDLDQNKSDFITILPPTSPQDD